jgi:hypothetical protein
MVKARGSRAPGGQIVVDHLRERDAGLARVGSNGVASRPVARRRGGTGVTAPRASTAKIIR